jgi:hypothetical protein
MGISYMLEVHLHQPRSYNVDLMPVIRELARKLHYKTDDGDVLQV